MIWGVGTGRCGTKSLAEDLGGLHEPKPWLGKWPALYRRRKCEPDKILPALKGRRDLDTLAIVDLKHSYVMDLIEQADPDGEFVYVIRAPHLCIASFLAGGSWTEQDWHGERKIAPEGWWTSETRLEKAIYHWVMTNRIVIEHLVSTRFPWRMFMTEELEAHKNVHIRSPDWAYSRTDADLIFRSCWSVWAKALALKQIELRGEN